MHSNPTLSANSKRTTNQRVVSGVSPRCNIKALKNLLGPATHRSPSPRGVRGRIWRMSARGSVLAVLAAAGGRPSERWAPGGYGRQFLTERTCNNQQFVWPRAAWVAPANQHVQVFAAQRILRVLGVAPCVAAAQCIGAHAALWPMHRALDGAGRRFLQSGVAR